MLSTIIIEDDFMSARLLTETLQEVEPGLTVKAVLYTVKEGIEYLKTTPEVDLIFSDIQLTDGLSFSIFEEAPVSCPIIFTSVYDQYMANVFEYSGIDYLLKPVGQDQLKMALLKYRNLERHFIGSHDAVRDFFSDYLTNRKTRIIVRKGVSNISLVLQDVVLFYTENLMVYVIDNKGMRYLVDKSLNSLEAELDKRIFFRANRQYILNINFIQGYKNYERVKLLVTLTQKEIDHLVIVGQEKARAFRHWLADA
jgi:DNA-binding LytR/AlgR family response regulator